MMKKLNFHQIKRTFTTSHLLQQEALSYDIPSNVVLTGICKERLTKKSEPKKFPGIPESCDNIVRHCNNSIPPHKQPVKQWVDDISKVEASYDKVACLHPKLFDVHPKMDILYQVVKWQTLYREVDYTWSRTRAEMGFGKRKPWPQKHTGRKRQGATNTPLWKGGGICNGPRGPKSLFYKLDDEVLVTGLTSALTIKYLQNDLIIASPMECPPENHDFHRMLVNREIESNSILFVHKDNSSPQYLGDALENEVFQSLMPLSALNVYSILKYDKLVLSMDILDELEDKIIWQLSRYDWLGKPHNYYKDLPGRKYGKDNIFIGS